MRHGCVSFFHAVRIQPNHDAHLCLVFCIQTLHSNTAFNHRVAKVALSRYKPHQLAGVRATHLQCPVAPVWRTPIRMR